jgi:hypothetical protein
MSRGRPPKDPGKKRSALIKVYLPKTKKQWIKNCAKGQGMSMSRYIEKVVDGQIESLQTEDFCTFLVRLRNNLKMVQDEIRHDTSKDIVLGYVESAIDRINNKGREIIAVASGPPSPEGSREEGNEQESSGESRTG